MAKFIQLFRNELNAVFADKATAKAALEANNINPKVLKDGMPILARYYTNGSDSEIKTLFGVAHNNGESAKVTVFDSSSIDELNSNITASTDTHFTKIDVVNGKVVQSSSTVSNVDVAKILDYVENTASSKTDTNLSTGDTIAEALAKVEQRVDIEEAARIAAIDGLEYNGVTSATTKVVTDVTQEDGLVNASTTNAEDLTLLTAPTTADSKVAIGDTIGGAFGKLQGQIDAMDLAVVSGEGKPIVSVSQTDGKVTATVGTIAATAVTVADAANVFTATEVEGALKELYDKSVANVITSPNETINVSTTTEGTTVDVNVDGQTIVYDADGTDKGKLKTNLTVVKVTTGITDTNVKEQYKLIVSGDTTQTAIGSPINIYKDSSLKTAYLGKMDDSVDANTGEVTPGTTGDTALCFVYHKEDGTYELVAVNVQTFLEESEFSDGLQVNNHVVSVKVDPTSEKVITGDSSATGDVLTVGASGVKVSNIQAAIDYAVSTLDASVNDSDDGGFVTVTVGEANGVLTGVTVETNDIASATALTAEIEARKAVDGIDGDAYTANTGTNYITGATSLNNADVLLDNTIATLSGKTVTTVEMTGGTAAIAAANDGTKKITINTDGSQVKLDGYTSGTAQADIDANSTVNQAIGQLEYRIAQGTSGLQNEVDAIETAVGLNNNGTHAASTGHYTSEATTIEGEIIALDTKLSGVANTYLSNAVSGNNGITVAVSEANETGKTATVSLKLDETTESNETDAQYVKENKGNVLQIKNDGLYLDSSWDCGFYSYQAQNQGN